MSSPVSIPSAFSASTKTMNASSLGNSVVFRKADLSSDLPPNFDSVRASAGLRGEGSISEAKLLLVQNVLPVLIAKNKDGSWNIDLRDPTGTSSTWRILKSRENMSIIHVGWVDTHVPLEEQAALSARLFAEFDCLPVFLPQDIADGYYAGFCKGTLWPLLHYSQVKNFDEEVWEKFQQANSLFAQVVSRHVSRNYSAIWVQDYHLFLLPALLRNEIPEGVCPKIGFFLHSPFPSSEIFRTSPVRSELLMGLLGSDLVGFQTFNDARHFTSCCAMVLGVDCSPQGVELSDGHFASVGTFPVGIEPGRLLQKLDDEDVQKVLAEYQRRFKGVKVILGRNRHDHMSGISKKFLAFEEFLIRHPEWRGKVALMQIDEPAILDDREGGDLKQLSSQLNQLAGRINGAYGTVDWMPIHFIMSPQDENSLIALMRLADAGCCSPLRDGMNIPCLEFVVCQRNKCAPLILSEFAGAAQSLSGARLINPWNLSEFADSFHEALMMSDADRRLKHHYNYEYTIRHTGYFWAKTFLQELLRLGPETTLPMLNFLQAKKAYDQAEARLILLDYDGTLVPISRLPSLCRPSTALLQALTALSADARNTLFVISGRDKATLDTWLSGTGVGLSCEHGLFTRPPGHTEWLHRTAELDLSWKETILPIMESYTDRTPGSWVEHKQVNLAWHYRNAEHEYAKEQAKELVLQLESQKLPIDVLRGKKTIEVRPRGINKGTVVRAILNQYPAADFILCIGDDRTDEDMFDALDNYPSAYTVMVDKKPTHAQFYLEKQSDVVKLVSLLCNVSYDGSPSRGSPRHSSMAESHSPI